MAKVKAEDMEEAIPMEAAKVVDTVGKSVARADTTDMDTMRVVKRADSVGIAVEGMEEEMAAMG